MNRITLDAGALIAMDRNDRLILSLLARLVLQVDTDLIALDGPDATVVGLLLARTGTSDIVDAHVVHCAQRAGQAVADSDPVDLRQISPDLQLVRV